MTVKHPVNDSLDRDNYRSDDLQKSNEFFSSKKIDGKKFSERDFDRRLDAKLNPNPNQKVCATEVETDHESIGSSDEMESPRSVAKFGQYWTPKNVVYVHSQILRIREEDSHLGEDIGGGLSGKDKVSASGRRRHHHHHHHHPVSSHLDVMIFSRPILPTSPLSGKSSTKTVH